jgi:hypothetical protein
MTNLNFKLDLLEEDNFWNIVGNFSSEVDLQIWRSLVNDELFSLINLKVG